MPKDTIEDGEGKVVSNTGAKGYRKEDKHSSRGLPHVADLR
jgi:hypothetical protein